MAKTRIILDEKDLEALVTSKVVTVKTIFFKHEIEIILADIGWRKIVEVLGHVYGIILKDVPK